MSIKTKSASFSQNFIITALKLQNRVLPDSAPYTRDDTRNDASPSTTINDYQKITIDSRKVTPGSLFVAIKGDHFDGHDFIANAISLGASGVILREDFEHPKNCSKNVKFFPVKNTLEAYRNLAAAWRNQFDIPVIVVAGSAGKTTTKELLFALLASKWKKVLKTEGSQNGFVGIPLTLLELRNEHEAAIIEVGIDEIGAMKKHMEVVRPNFSLLTAIGPEHLEKLRDVPTVAREEGIALEYVAASGGSFAVNLDDPWIKPHFIQPASKKRGSVVGFSLEQATASPLIIVGKLSPDMQNLICEGADLPQTTVPLPLPGKHNARNLLGAIAVATQLGLTGKEIQNGIKNFRPAEGRSQIYRLENSTIVICDYYNSQPVSLVVGLELLENINPNHSPRWACLGDMLELGVDEEKYHREIANQIINHNIQNVLLYGSKMKWLADELQKRNFPKPGGYLAHFTSHSEMASEILNKMQNGDALLIKGSRGMKMEKVWQILEPHFLKSLKG